MAFNYAATRATSDRLLAKFGQAVSLRRTTTSGTAWDPTNTTTDYATTAAILDYTAQQVANSQNQPGMSGNILVTDRRALVAAGPLTTLGITSIAPPDSLVVAGAAVPIVRVTPLAPAGTVVMYECQLRF